MINIFFLVTKKQSLFDDKPKEIQELTYLIKEDLNNLNSGINQLQEVSLSVLFFNDIKKIFLSFKNRNIFLPFLDIRNYFIDLKK